MYKKTTFMVEMILMILLAGSASAGKFPVLDEACIANGFDEGIARFLCGYFIPSIGDGTRFSMMSWTNCDSVSYISNPRPTGVVSTEAGVDYAYPGEMLGMVTKSTEADITYVTFCSGWADTCDFYTDIGKDYLCPAGYACLGDPGCVDQTPPQIELTISSADGSECSPQSISSTSSLSLGDGESGIVHGCSTLSVSADEPLASYSVEISDDVLVSSFSFPPDSEQPFDFYTVRQGYVISVEASDAAGNVQYITVFVNEDDDADGVGDPDDLCPLMSAQNDVEPKDGCEDGSEGQLEEWSEFLPLYLGSAKSSMTQVVATGQLSDPVDYHGVISYHLDSTSAGIDALTENARLQQTESQGTEFFRAEPAMFGSEQFGSAEVMFKRNRDASDLMQSYHLEMADGAFLHASQKYFGETDTSEVKLIYKDKASEAACKDSCQSEKEECLTVCAKGDKICQDLCREQAGACQKSCTGAFMAHETTEYPGLKTVSIYDIMMWRDSLS